MVLIKDFDFDRKDIKGKENRVVDALNRSVQEVLLGETSVGESNIKQRIKNILQQVEIFNLVKESLHQETSMKKYEEFHLTKYKLLLYNNMLYAPN